MLKNVSYNVFYPIIKKKHHLSHVEIVLCKCFQFGSCHDLYGISNHGNALIPSFARAKGQLIARVKGRSIARAKWGSIARSKGGSIARANWGSISGVIKSGDQLSEQNWGIHFQNKTGTNCQSKG